MNGSPGGGLNPRPHTYKACALTTTELRDNCKNGASYPIRTDDLQITNLLHYHCAKEAIGFN